VLCANLARALFARFHGKLLIPRLGPSFSWLERCPLPAHCHGRFGSFFENIRQQQRRIPLSAREFFDSESVCANRNCAGVLPVFSVGETLGASSASLNRGAPASHRSEFRYAEDTLSRALRSRLRLRSSTSLDCSSPLNPRGIVIVILKTGRDRLEARGYR
jgi:hypothetical protein